MSLVARIAGVKLLAPVALACSVLVPGMALAQSAASLGNTVVVKTPLDDWQVRRRQTLGYLQVLGNDKATAADQKLASDKLDAILTRADKEPLTFTPMELMDLYEAYYVPTQPKAMETNLFLVALIATLGWYDALRFGDESGRAEIANNEAFFKRALMAQSDAFIALLQNEPKKAAAAVEKATSLARDIASQSDKVRYDTHWPASYGLLRMQCGMEGKKTCPKPPELPKKDWPAAMDNAVARVTHYYRVNK